MEGKLYLPMGILKSAGLRTSQLVWLRMLHLVQQLGEEYELADGLSLRNLSSQLHLLATKYILEKKLHVDCFCYSTSYNNYSFIPLDYNSSYLVHSVGEVSLSTSTINTSVFSIT